MDRFSISFYPTLPHKEDESGKKGCFASNVTWRKVPEKGNNRGMFRVKLKIEKSTQNMAALDTSRHIMVLYLFYTKC